MLRTLLMGGTAALLTGCFALPSPSEPDLADQAGTQGTSGAQGPQGSQTAPPSKEEASRFLVQATFGANETDIETVQRQGFAAWIDAQTKMPAPSLLARIDATPEPNRHTLSDLFWSHAVDGEDQLRQRVAYALSQITVVSMRHEMFWGHPHTFAHYMDILQRGAFGNYQDVVHEVSLSPAMGHYLSSLGNRKADEEHGYAPDENYAREVMQLFTIGLEELRPDGTSTGRETYTVEDIKGLASVFTGLSWQDTGFRWPKVEPHNRAKPMVSYDEYHEPGPKTFLGATIDVGTDAEASVRAALDHLLSHDNLAPFISKQLIQKLVTSNPSGPYVARVGAAFEAGVFEADGRRFGEGRRGDLTATVAAILLDEEARDVRSAARPDFGAVREPALRFAQFARAFRDGDRLPTRGGVRDVGRMRYADSHRVLGQSPYNPPSVFGFTRPDHKAQGGWSAQAGLVAPGLAMAGGVRTASYIDLMAGSVTGERDDYAAFKPDYARYLPLTEEPGALVDALDAVLTYGTLSDASRARIVEALDAVVIDERDTEKDKRNRMHLAVLMMVTTPEYGVLR